jgi:hypothetical protein
VKLDTYISADELWEQQFAIGSKLEKTNEKNADD